MRRTIGFQAYRRRLEQECITERGLLLDDVSDDDSIYHFYRQGEPTSFVLASLTTDYMTEDSPE